jgi:transposase
LEQKAEFVKLYASGISFNRIAKLKGTSHTTARRWVTSFAENQLPEKPPVTTPVQVIEMDEQWHYLQKKQQALALEGSVLPRGSVTGLGGGKAGRIHSKAIV